MMQSCRYYTARNWWDGDKDTSKAKHYYRLLVINVQSLTQFLLIRTRHHIIHTKEKKRPPS